MKFGLEMASKGPEARISPQEPLKKKPSMSSIQADLARQLGEHSGFSQPWKFKDENFCKMSRF